MLPHKVYENLLTKPYAMENHVNGMCRGKASSSLAFGFAQYVQPRCKALFARVSLPIPESFHHPMAGLAWTAIAENPTLVDFFDVLTLSIDRGGRTYVSTMEAIDYPITATQWCAGGRF